MRAPANSSDHLHALDSIRGILALCIIAVHFGWRSSLTGTLFQQNLHVLVDFFFVLSGFVIALNYGARIRDGGEFARFVWLRFWRIYPLHLVTLLAIVAFELARWFAARHLGAAAQTAALGHNSAAAFVSNLFLLQAFTPFAASTFNVPSWSIGAEFWAYMVFAVTALLAGRRLAWASALAIAVSFVLLLRAGNGMAASNEPLSLARALFGFFCGVAASFVYARFERPALSRPAAALLCAVPLCAFAALVAFKTGPLWDFAAPPLSVLIILSLALGPPNPVSGLLSRRPIVWVGEVSYSIYMVHYLVIDVVARLAKAWLHLAPGPHGGLVTPPWLGDLLGLIVIVLSVGIAALTYRWIEAPGRAWSKTAWPAPRRRAVAPVPSGAAP